MFINTIAAKEIEVNNNYIEIVSELEKIIETIDDHAIKKNIILAFDTNIDKYYMKSDLDFINNNIKNILSEYINNSKYGESIYITLFVSDIRTKLNINTEELYFNSRIMEFEKVDV